MTSARSPRIPTAVLVGFVALLVTTTTGGPVGARTPPTPPGDYRSALAARLGAEWSDPALAADVVAGLGDDLLASLEAKVPLGAVGTSPLLAYRLRSRPAAAFDSVIVYAFGYHDAPDGGRDPGPVNEALAASTRKLRTLHPRIPVYAQTEIAEILTAAGVRGVTSIDPVVGPDGRVVYLSTAGVAAQAKEKAAASGVDLGTVAVVAFADHLGRSVLTTEAAGLDAGVAKGVRLPSTYDPESAQPWTRDRRAYLSTDLLARVATL